VTYLTRDFICDAKMKEDGVKAIQPLRSPLPFLKFAWLLMAFLVGSPTTATSMDQPRRVSSRSRGLGINSNEPRLLDGRSCFALNSINELVGTLPAVNNYRYGVYPNQTTENVLAVDAILEMLLDAIEGLGESLTAKHNRLFVEQLRNRVRVLWTKSVDVQKHEAEKREGLRRHQYVFRRRMNSADARNKKGAFAGTQNKLLSFVAHVNNWTTLLPSEPLDTKSSASNESWQSWTVSMYFLFVIITLLILRLLNLVGKNKEASSLCRRSTCESPRNPSNGQESSPPSGEAPRVSCTPFRLACGRFFLDEQQVELPTLTRTNETQDDENILESRSSGGISSMYDLPHDVYNELRPKNMESHVDEIPVNFLNVTNGAPAHDLPHLWSVESSEASTASATPATSYRCSDQSLVAPTSSTEKSSRRKWLLRGRRKRSRVRSSM